ncbi:MAG: SDR family NAD(P)-dependent oxidoreductase, partial [Verrucomicrobiota bacterium]
MTPDTINELYDFSGKTLVLTGGTGVLGGEMARALSASNANLVLLVRNEARAQSLLESLPKSKGRHLVLGADVLHRAAVEEAGQVALAQYGRIDGLINGAGGNDPKATTSPQHGFFDIPAEAFQHVINLNLVGTVVPTQVFGRFMADRKQGVIVNISSVSAERPLTRVGAYAAAKAGISNLTQWLAVHMAEEYSPDIRVNAIMPGFFQTEQNRFLLTDKETGALTERGNKII